MADKKEESTPKKPEKAKPIGEKVSNKNIEERSRNIARETKKEFGSILTGIESISKVYSGLTSEQTRALTVSKQSLTTLLDS